MITKVFGVYDSKAKAYWPPVYLQQEGLAIRQFTDMVNDGKSTPSKYPADFILYRVGSWDDQTCLFTNEVPPVQLAVGIECVKVQPELPIMKFDREKGMHIEKSNSKEN